MQIKIALLYASWLDIKQYAGGLVETLDGAAINTELG
jgi:hypothetical protein